MTTGQIISVIFLLVMVVLVVRGIRGHPRRNAAVDLDSTGHAVGDGAMRMANRLETESFSDAGGGGD